jgi:methionyl-tRNA formyltransferase
MNIEDVNVKEEPRILFMGTPEFAVPILEGLFEHYKVRAVITQPDRPVGRDGKIVFSPIKKCANEHTVLVLQPEKLKDALEEIYALKPNLIITCAYGNLVPRELLIMPKYGCINVHASLLPKYRGGAPIHRAVMNGETKTGITIMHMNPYLDEGDIIVQKEIPIEDTDTASIIHDKLKILGRDLLLETLPSIIEGSAPRIPQEENEATFAFTIRKEDEKIDFNKSKYAIYNQVRGLNAWPGAYAILRGKRMKIWKTRISEAYYPEKINGTITNFYPDGIGVKVDNGEIVLMEIQPEGKGKMLASDYLNGIQDKANLLGEIFE